MPLISGLFAYPITPADAEGRVDALAVRRLVRRLVDAKVDGIGLLGSTGTYAFLTRAERRRAIDAAMDEAGGALPILVGVGALRTDEAVALARDAKAAGATAGLLAPVSYTPLLDEEVYVHFDTVAGESGLPICIYNNPAVTHFTFSADLEVRLSGLTGVIGVKNGAPPADQVGAHLAHLRARVPVDFSLGYSADPNAAEAMIAGADAWHSVLAGVLPEPVLAIVRAARAGDAAQARRLNTRLAEVWAMFGELSGLRLAYAAANALGLAAATPPRPILPLSADAQARVAAAIQSLSHGVNVAEIEA